MMTMKFEKGITFIEIIVAIAILAVGIVAVLQAFPSGMHLAKSAQMTTTAGQLAQAKIEQTLAKFYHGATVGTVTEQYGAINDFTAYKRTTEINCLRASDLSVQSCDYDLANDPYPIKKVEVFVYWRSSLGVTEKNVSLMSLISKK